MTDDIIWQHCEIAEFGETRVVRSVVLCVESWIKNVSILKEAFPANIPRCWVGLGAVGLLASAEEASLYLPLQPSYSARLPIKAAKYTPTCKTSRNSASWKILVEILPCLGCKLFLNGAFWEGCFSFFSVLYTLEPYVNFCFPLVQSWIKLHFPNIAYEAGERE